MLPRSTLRAISAASFGGSAFVLGCGTVLAFAAENPESYHAADWLYVLGGTTLGAVVGATEASRIATQQNRGAVRVAVVAALAALVTFAVVVTAETLLGTSGTFRSLVAAQEAFSGAVGGGLVCGGFLYFPVFLLWGALGASVFGWALRRSGRRAV